MRFIIQCKNCEHNIRFYYSASPPYSERIRYNGDVYLIFDKESCKGMAEDVRNKSAVQSSHYIPCPHCDFINRIWFEMIKEYDNGKSI